MTLIVGLRCHDGIVVGADGAATYGSLGSQTIRQATSKLEIVADRLIIGTSGPVGLGQRFHAELSDAWKGNQFSGKTAVAAMTHLSAKFRPHILSEADAAQHFVKTVGNA